jgi:AraC family transcriptional regulator
MAKHQTLPNAGVLLSRLCSVTLRPIRSRSTVKASSSRLGNLATLREPVASRPLTPSGQLDTGSFAEHFQRTCPSQQEHRSAGPLKLFRAPHREAGSFCTPPARGVSIRMNRSLRDGTKTVDHGAGRFSGSLDRHYTVAPANLVCTCELSSELDFLALEFPRDAFEDHLGTRGDLGQLHAKCQKDELVMQLVERLWRESAEGLTMLEADGLSLALVALLVRASRPNPRKPQPHHILSNRLLGRMLEYIEDHLADEFSVSDLSHAAGGSTTEITSGFRAATGYSPWQFVLRRRVERAQSLLTSSQLAMTEIALACGFSSSQHFATAFKKQVGTTPSAFRRDWMS